MAKLSYRCLVSARKAVQRGAARALFVALLLALATVAPSAWAEANDRAPAVHTVYSGHTLGKIAKRYRVTLGALCNANDIPRNHKIQPGDKLVVPARTDKDGSQAREQREHLLNGGKPKPATSKTPPTKKSPAKTAELKRHKVYKGQTLGMIARRYRISVDALVNANAMSASDPIRPGDELIIPDPSDKDGSKARAANSKVTESSDAPETPKAEPKVEKPAAKTKSSDEPRVHMVGPGNTLGKIANRYGVSVQALCHANEITKSSPLQVNQELVVPDKNDEDGSRALAWRRKELRALRSGRSTDRSWRDYKKMAWKRGYITLESPNGDKRWKGYVIGPGNKLLPLARQKVTKVLASWRTGKTKTIDRRLVQLIAKVSDTFGGRTIRVVSGYREHSHSKSSRHPEGRAMDFSIQGVPNWALRDYLRTLPNVGVGFYPNSSFVHFDVRDKSTYWVDVSKPGETPRYVHMSYGSKK